MNKRDRKIRVQAAPTVKAMKIDKRLLARADEKNVELKQIVRYMPPVGVIPPAETKTALAMDSTDYSYVNQVYGGQQQFLGYPYLAMLAQRPEFRKMSETIAREMTRKWIEIVCTGDEDKSEKIKQLDDAMRRYRVRDAFRRAAEYDGLYGRGQIYIDVKKPDGVPAFEDQEELKTPLILDKAKITKDSLIGFNTVEPVWTYPSAFNADQPLRPDYYKPNSWYVMGTTVHKSRLMTFVSREVPDILKAAYNFGGLSLSQMAEPYVDNWIRTRNSVGDMIHSFSLTVLKTNLQGTLSGSDDGTDLFTRVDLFNRVRDNRGAMVVDKDSEEIDQINTPLSGLDALQAQAQEQMASVSSIPLVFLLGITPQGLNASSEGEILVFETTIHAMQELLFADNLKTVLDVIQLSEFGEIDPEITFKFVPLREMTEKELAEIRQIDAAADAALIGAGVLSPEDSLMRIAADPNSPYHGLETNSDAELLDDE